jgi:predicted RNase H-like HicB family nuclease
MRQGIIYPREDGYWVAQCPSLPPCISQGNSTHSTTLFLKSTL